MQPTDIAKKFTEYYHLAIKSYERGGAVCLIKAVREMEFAITVKNLVKTATAKNRKVDQKIMPTKSLEGEGTAGKSTRANNHFLSRRVY